MSLSDVNGRRKVLLWSTVCLALAVAGALLFAFQYQCGRNFPYSDEWGYVARLRELPRTGLLYALFGKYQAFFMPTFFCIWYLFYKLTHLNLMLMRYVAVLVSVSASALLCLLLFRTAKKVTIYLGGAMICGVFVICSYNHFGTYTQAIESFVEPLLFGLVLASIWAGENEIRSGNDLPWIPLCILFGLLASGIYASGLAAIPAVICARYMVTRKVDPILKALILMSLSVPLIYLVMGRAVGSHSMLRTLDAMDLLRMFRTWIALLGNAVLSPGIIRSGRILPYIIGMLILLIQFFGLWYVMRQPAEGRQRFALAIATTAYSFFVFIEIAVFRFQNLNLGFTPRYSIQMLGGVVSVLAWIVVFADAAPWGRWLAILSISLIGIGVWHSYNNVHEVLPYVVRNVRANRALLVNLHSDPTPAQQRKLYVNPELVRLVYPDLKFMRANGLALFASDRHNGT